MESVNTISNDQRSMETALATISFAEHTVAMLFTTFEVNSIRRMMELEKQSESADLRQAILCPI